MKSLALRTIIYGGLLAASIPLSAQQNLRLHSDAQLRNFGNMSVYGNLTNEGNLNSEDTSQTTFMGVFWKNSQGANFNGDGQILFLQPNPLTGNASAQNLDAAGQASSLPNLELANREGLFLLATDAHIRGDLLFTDGRIILDGNNLQIEQGGDILGYNENRFVVTNGFSTDNHGFLVRHVAANSTDVDFPVGLAEGEYTPARLNNSGSLGDNFRVRSFLNVYDQGVTGGFANWGASVGRSWQINQDVDLGNQINISLTLQHDESMEGSSFSPSSNFIARYVGTAPNMAGGAQSLEVLSTWDYVGKNACGENFQGDITSTTPLPSMKSNVRHGLTDFARYQYYTAHSCGIEESEFEIPSAFSPNGDGSNDNWEIDNIHLFEQRSIKIISRWGDIIFESPSYENNWDGLFQGKRLPDGTYYYILDLGSWGIRKGPVTIVRN